MNSSVAGGGGVEGVKTSPVLVSLGEQKRCGWGAAKGGSHPSAPPNQEQARGCLQKFGRRIKTEIGGPRLSLPKLELLGPAPKTAAPHPHPFPNPSPAFAGELTPSLPRSVRTTGQSLRLGWGSLRGCPAARTRGSGPQPGASPPLAPEVQILPELDERGPV